ncbi:MAG: hypothetical protein HYZ50_05260 [Deltaproteobacteria bacterium]|nr:hypothetical protein [Deltaproteobacteria bacterium]
MYACDRSTRVAGFTMVMKRAERLASAIGLATWDLIVLRSPGTPAAGLLFVRAYQRTHEEKYLAAARRTGDLLVNIQLSSGGWFSEMPVYGDRLAWWFPWIVPGTTLDDDVTSGTARFLVALWEVTGEPRYKDAALCAFDLLLKAQLSSGAWPLTWRPTWRRFLRPSFEDWPSLNDAATTGPIQACLVGARSLNRPELLEAAKRGGTWLIHARHLNPNAGWAQQYDEEGRPAPGRRFEPSGLATWESRHALEALQALAEATGDRGFCAPFPETIDWLKRSALSPGCWARLYSVDANTPVYMDQQGNFVPSTDQTKRPYNWTGDFGIPALFAQLGVDLTGMPQRECSRSSTSAWLLPGDAGHCPSAMSKKEREEGNPLTLSPRTRIKRAATLFGLREPSGAAACAPLVAHPLP